MPLDPDAVSALPLLSSPTQKGMLEQEVTYRCGELLVKGQAGDSESPPAMQLRVSPPQAPLLDSNH